MTGWRLGWLLVPESLRRTVDCLTGNFTICPPVLPQVAAVAAFTRENPSRKPTAISGTRANRELLLNGLRDIGIDRLAPTDGAFYVYRRLPISPVTHCRSARSCWPTPGWQSPGIDFDRRGAGRSSVVVRRAGVPTSLRRCPGWGRGCGSSQTPRCLGNPRVQSGNAPRLVLNYPSAW